MKVRAILLFFLLLPIQVMSAEIALFVPRTESASWQSQIRFAQAAANDLGVTLHVYDAENQPETMLKQVSQACEKGVDGVLFMNYEQIGEKLLTITEKCKIPSILFNTGFNSRDFLPRTKYRYWIGEITPNDIKAGSVLAEQLLLKANGQINKVKMLVLNGNLKELSAIERNQGLYQFIRHNPSVTVVAESDSNMSWGREEAKRQFKHFYQRHPEINMVWAASDTIALGARDAMRELELPLNSIYIGGVDWLPEALRVIEEGEPYISVGGHFTEAAWSMILLNDYLDGHDFIAESTQFRSPFYSINHANVAMFQSFIDDNWQRIDFQALSKQHESDKLYNFSIKFLLDGYYQNTKALKLTDEEVEWLRDHNELRLAIDIDWPPFEYVDGSGEYQGIAADYIKLIAQRLGIELVPSTNMSWSEVVEASKQRALDIYPALPVTQDREQYLDFTRPYLSFPLMIITNQDIPYVRDIEALNGMQVAAVEGYSSYELLRDNHPQIKLYAAENVSDALQSVASGKVDAYVGNIATANYVMTREGYSNLKVSGLTPYRIDLRMAVRSDWPILNSILQKSLDALSEEEKQTIYSRWVTVRYEHGVDYSLVWKIALVSLSVLILLSYWTSKLSKLNDKLNSEITERKQIEQQLLHEKNKIEQLSITDPLTGLFNRRYYNKKLPTEILRAQSTQDWLSFVIIDVDDFKQYNDHYGHLNGDKQLVEFANALKKQCHQSSDYCFRLGGEEFGVLFTGRSPEEAISFVNQIRQEIESLQLEHQFSRASDVITASFGIVTTNKPKYTMEQLYETADAALYDAKESGRNKVVAKELK
ncbi:diguanylate cyclase [Vibrio tubiashii]|uniref:Autoinducer 2-binding periplasmic protein LuxP n=1 Tax=Vibrio tubiashii TaxID=29498 RepID=A0AAE5GN96_9VIBR|nr:diguanylate cyclase [Vibrio tubiashii]NOI79985.1 diguanylate cyclase [Vibrio tubiashii]